MSEGQIVETLEKDRKQSDSSDTEYDPQFKPIITLPEVEVSTNEENERELLKIRAKLYRFDSSIDPPEWKERGTGELKLLVHNESRSVRVVMRRDKTLKVCANHFITPFMELKPSAGSDKAFVYTVFVDFADERPKSECLAVKFGTVDNATLFKTKFKEAQHIVATECDLYNGKGEQFPGNASETSEEGEDENNDESKDNASDDGECDQVTKKISELEVSETEDK